MIHTFVVPPQGAGERLDKYLCGVLPALSRSFLQHLIEEGGVTVDGEPALARQKPAAGSVICVTLPAPRALDVRPEDIPLDLVYEDADIAVINKPQGMVVHPAAGNYTGTLVSALLYHVKDLSGINGVLRPGIVHRIDKDTSGLLVVAKNDAAHLSLAEQIAQKTASREYLALVYGRVSEPGTVDAPIGRHKTDRKRMAVVPGGKPAVTHYRPVEEFSGYTLVRAALSTGRTHQIRVHMMYIGHPVVGDPVYGVRKCPFALAGQLLHAERLVLMHPRTGERMEFFAPLPDHFERVLKKLRQTT